MTKDEKELVQLCWWIIERKVAYYRPEALHSTRMHDYVVSDEDYDAAEVRYLTLIRKLNEKAGEVRHLNTLVHKGWPGFEDMYEPPHDPMMEIDDSRHSVKLVLKKLGSIKHA